MKLMSCQQIISAEEKAVIERGDNGEYLRNPNEMQIYVNNLIRNKKYYIRRKIEQVYQPIDFKVASLMGLFFSTIGCCWFEGVLNVNSLPVFCGICGAGVGISFLTYAITNISARIDAKKAINNQIQELSERFDATKEKESSLMLTQSKATFDAFIDNIQKDIRRAASIQYPTYEQDIEKLYLLAESYLKCKQEVGSVRGNDILLQDKKWIQQLVEIETRINQGESLKNEQRANAEMLSMIRKLCQEKIDLKTISTDASLKAEEEETTGSKGFVLTLGGK